MSSYRATESEPDEPMASTVRAAKKALRLEMAARLRTLSPELLLSECASRLSLSRSQNVTLKLV